MWCTNTWAYRYVVGLSLFLHCFSRMTEKVFACISEHYSLRFLDILPCRVFLTSHGVKHNSQSSSLFPWYLTPLATLWLKNSHLFFCCCCRFRAGSACQWEVFFFPLIVTGRLIFRTFTCTQFHWSLLLGIRSLSVLNWHKEIGTSEIGSYLLILRVWIII